MSLKGEKSIQGREEGMAFPEWSELRPVKTDDLLKELQEARISM